MSITGHKHEHSDAHSDFTDDDLIDWLLFVFFMVMLAVNLNWQQVIMFI